MRVERTEGGLAIRIARAPLWLIVAGCLVPSGIVGAAFLVFAFQTRSPGVFIYPAIMLLGVAFRDASRWRRSSDSLLLLEEGVLLRADGATGPTRSRLRLGLGPDATIRAHGHVSGWALQDLIALTPEPRVRVRSAGSELTLGVGLGEDEAHELVEELGASPAFREARESLSPAVAPVVRVKGALGGRGAIEDLSEKQVARATQPDRLWPLRLAKGSNDLGVLLAATLFFVFVWVQTIVGPQAFPPLAVISLFVVIPALIRVSRTLFAGTYTAQVMGEPARPGRDVTIRVSLDRHAPVFEWIDIRLQYIRVTKREDEWFSKFRRELQTNVVWEGLYTLPTDRLPPGPDEHVDAVFALPLEVPPTPGGKKVMERWRLEVTGRTTHGAFDETFRVIVLPPILPQRA